MLRTSAFKKSTTGLALVLLLAAAVQADRLPCVFKGVERVVAIGDLHGAYEPFVKILRAFGVVDDELRWIGGRSHCVQMGDVIDRGPDARRIYDLIRRLEGEAREAGGRFHMLIGNHEEMNILNLGFESAGTVPVEQFLSFLPDAWRRAKERELRAKAGAEADLRPYWQDLMDSSPDARRIYTDFFNKNYGLWIASHNSVIKIDEVVFVHGGLSESLSLQPCEMINARISNALTRYIREGIWDETTIYDPRGPFWYRDLAQKDEDTLREEVDRILANLDARAIVVGHTPVPDSVTLRRPGRLDGKVWLIDTGIWMRDGIPAALIIEGGRISVKGVDRWP